MRYVYTCRLSWGDLDAYGHLNNVRLLRYLEDARVAMLFVDAVGRGAPGMSRLLVARHEIDYLRPLEWRPEPVRVEMWVSTVRAAQFTLGYEIRDGDGAGTPANPGDGPYVQALSVLVPYDFRRAGPRRLTPEEREFLAGYREP